MRHSHRHTAVLSNGEKYLCMHSLGPRLSISAPQLTPRSALRGSVLSCSAVWSKHVRRRSTAAGTFRTFRVSVFARVQPVRVGSTGNRGHCCCCCCKTHNARARALRPPKHEGRYRNGRRRGPCVAALGTAPKLLLRTALAPRMTRAPWSQRVRTPRSLGGVRAAAACAASRAAYR